MHPLLNRDRGYVPHSVHMSYRNPVITIKFFSSFGTHLLYHPAPNAASLAGGRVTVVDVGQCQGNASACVNGKCTAIFYKPVDGRDVSLWNRRIWGGQCPVIVDC